MKLSEIGEFGLIDIIKSMAKTEDGIYGIGDDCAVIPISSAKELVVTTDTLVENVHFFKDANAYYLGRKSLSVNISDVAAMAGVPKWTFLSLSLNPDMELEYMKSFMKGFYSVADEYRIMLLGGDTTKGSAFSITVTLVGENGIGESVKREGAGVRDDVYVTGSIGCSYAGFVAIRDNINGFDDLKHKHINPVPRLKEALAVKRFASAMIDISDGLLQDCGHICEKSDVSIEMNFDKIPFCKTGLIKREEMLSGGEDYELVFCAKKQYRKYLENIKNITRIGIVKNGFGVSLVGGNEYEVKAKGFNHF